MDAQVVILQRFGDVFCIVGNLFADRADFYLYGRKPKWKRPGVVLDENSKKALDGAEQRAMDHQRLMFCAVLGDILQSEARGQVEIKLYRGELPRTPDGINELHINFWPVERRFALNLLERDIHFLQGIGECSAGAVPVFRLAGVILRMRRIPV